jgi:hypothetical protein
MSSEKSGNPFRPRFVLEQNLKESLEAEHCPTVRTAADIAVLFEEIAQLHREVMIAGALDTKCRVLHCSLLAVGTTDHLLLRVGDAFFGAIQTGASSIFLVHNHPSGSLTPSRADLELTQTVAEAGIMLGYPLVDHVVVSRRGHSSLLTSATLMKYYPKARLANALYREAAEGETRVLTWKCGGCKTDNGLPSRISTFTPVSSETCLPAHCTRCGELNWIKCALP